MNQNKLSFESENRNIDWLSITFPFLDQETREKKIQFFDFIEFLVFLETKSFTIEYLGDTEYRRIQFPISQLLDFQGRTHSTYQIGKLKDFFEKLQTKRVMEVFGDDKYASLVAVPKLVLQKHQRKVICESFVVDALFNYTYPYCFSNLLKKNDKKVSKLELFVRQHLILSVVQTQSIEKSISVSDLINLYPSTLSNQDKALVRVYLIDSLESLIKDNILESEVSYSQNSSSQFLPTTVQELKEKRINFTSLRLIEIIK